MRRTLILVVALIAVGVPGLMADVLPLNTWESFFWDDGGTLPSATTPATWTFTTTAPTQLQVTDGFNIGDEFSVQVAGTVNTTFNTSAINPALDGTLGSGSTGPTSWADTDYSHGAINLGPGTYTVTLDIIRNAAGFTAGGAFIQDTTAAPEPGTIALLLTVLAGVGFSLRRKQQAGS